MAGVDNALVRNKINLRNTKHFVCEARFRFHTSRDINNKILFNIPLGILDV